jgi:hypothetical protein
VDEGRIFLARLGVIAFPAITVTKNTPEDHPAIAVCGRFLPVNLSLPSFVLILIRAGGQVLAAYNQME